MNKIEQIYKSDLYHLFGMMRSLKTIWNSDDSMPIPKFIIKEHKGIKSTIIFNPSEYPRCKFDVSLEVESPIKKCLSFMVYHKTISVMEICEDLVKKDYEIGFNNDEIVGIINKFFSHT